jgi:hypothetical protein
MRRPWGLPVAVWMGCALLLLGASVAVAASSGDAALMAGSACAALGLLLLASPRPRQVRTAQARWRRGVRVRKATALEGRLREGGAPPTAPARGPTHHAA